MTIYIDLILLLNFFFDLVILASVNYIVRRNASILRILLGSLVGTITMIFLFVEMPNFLFLFIKFFISLLMIFTSFGFKDIHYFSKNILYFYLISMLLGGAITFLNNQFSYQNKGMIFYNKGLSISYMIVIIIVLVIFVYYLKNLKNLKNHYSHYYNCSLFFNFTEVKLNAFLDTGNKLKDPYSNKGILLVDEKKIKKFICKENPIYVPFSTLNNHGILSCFKASKIVIDGKESNNFLVGISNVPFFIDGIDCILNETIMEGLN